MSVTAPCAAPGRDQQLRGGDDVEDAVGLEACFNGDAGEDALVGADHDDVAAGGAAPGGNQAGQDVLQAIDGRGALLPARR